MKAATDNSRLEQSIEWEKKKTDLIEDMLVVQQRNETKLILYYKRGWIIKSIWKITIKPKSSCSAIIASMFCICYGRVL